MQSGSSPSATSDLATPASLSATLSETGLFDECTPDDTGVSCCKTDAYCYFFYVYGSRDAMIADMASETYDESLCTDMSEENGLLGENWFMLDGGTADELLDKRQSNFELVAKAVNGEILTTTEIYCDVFALDPVNNPDQREAGPWMPEGFQTLAVNDLFAVQWVKDAQSPCSANQNCAYSTMNLVSRFNCPGGVSVWVNFSDSNEIIYDSAADNVPILQAGEIAQLQFWTTQSPGTSTTTVTKAECYG